MRQTIYFVKVDSFRTDFYLAQYGIIFELDNNTALNMCIKYWLHICQWNVYSIENIAHVKRSSKNIARQNSSKYFRYVTSYQYARCVPSIKRISSRTEQVRTYLRMKYHNQKLDFYVRCLS